MDTKVVVCSSCRQTYRFHRPKMKDENVVVVGKCACGNPVTVTWRPPSRWSLLEVD